MVTAPSTACVRAAPCSSLLSALRASLMGLNTLECPGHTQAGIPQTSSCPAKEEAAREPGGAAGAGPQPAWGGTLETPPLPCRASALSVSNN